MPGITRNFFCRLCGFEGRLHGGLCTRCAITERLSELLDDDTGTGTVKAELMKLADVLYARPKPSHALKWLTRAVQTLRSDLATSGVPLTHEALHGVTS